jgi:hypothetical protein
MSGAVEWPVLIFVAGLVVTCLGIGIGGVTVAWRLRGLFADYQIKYDLQLVALHNSVQDRNFLIKYDLQLADHAKDIRHTKGNLDQHAEIMGEMHDDLIRAQAELIRLAKIVNGKH